MSLVFSDLQMVALATVWQKAEHECSWLPGSHSWMWPIRVYLQASGQDTLTTLWQSRAVKEHLWCQVRSNWMCMYQNKQGNKIYSNQLQSWNLKGCFPFEKVGAEELWEKRAPSYKGQGQYWTTHLSTPLSGDFYDLKLQQCYSR